MTVPSVRALRPLLAVVLAAAPLIGSDAEPGREAEPAPVGWNREYFASVPGDALAVVTAPSRWGPRQWGEAALVGGAGLALYAYDERIDAWIQDHRTDTTDRLARVAKPFGREVIAVGLVGVAGASLVVDDPRITRTALLGAESLLFAGVGYQGLQYLTNRPRPESGEGRDAWGGPALHSDDHSFPSGHTTAAFAAATVVAHEWGGTPGVAPVAYGIATLVGLSRLNDHAHWASDVFAGAVLGWGCATVVEAAHAKPGSVSVSPIWGAHERGVAMEWRF